MKNLHILCKLFFMKKISIVSAVLAIILSSCAQYTHMQVMQPSVVTIPPHIIKIGIINRSVVDRNNQNQQFVNVLEGIITGESIGADRIASDRAMEGVMQALNQTGRYEVSIPAVNVPGADNPYSSQPLDYNMVNAICSRHGLDGLLVLENFDSDSRIRVDQRVNRVSRNGRIEDVIDFVATAELRVRTTWKFYSDSTRSIIDQHSFEDLNRFTSAGINPPAAQAGLPSKRQAINTAGYHAGEIYGKRISPFWINVSRRYYKKGSDALENAAANAKRGNWKYAIDVWKKEANNSNREIAGRAIYNLAVAAEREGNLELALDYARQSRDQYNNKWARNYVPVISNRISNRRVLEYQMSGGN